MHSHREVEDKYDVDAAAPFPVLAHIAGVDGVDPPAEQVLEAVYFDTADLALNSARITLRKRTGGEDAGWHLKLPGDGARHEIRVPLRGSSAAVPPSVRSVLLGLVDGRELMPILTLRTDRTVHRLRDRSGSVLAEVADDRVDAEHLVDVGRPGQHRWREWEVELVDADETLLAPVGAAFVAAGAQPSVWASKFARALDAGATTAGMGEPRLSPESPAAELGEWYLAQQYHRLLACDPLVRCELPDAIHLTRVTTRRLRAALEVFRPLLRREVTDPISDELAWLCSTLGAARDAEVMVERLHHMLASDVVESERDAVRDRITRDLGEEYATAYRRARLDLESNRYLSLLKDLRALTSDPPWRPAARKTVRATLLRRLRHDWRRLEEAVDALHREQDTDVLDQRLHAVRKAAKHVRYAAEPLTVVYGRKAERLVESVTRLQTVLGAHQDSVVTRACVDRLHERASSAGERTEGFEALAALNEGLASRTAAEFEAEWHAASRKKLRRWLD